MRHRYIALTLLTQLFFDTALAETYSFTFIYDWDASEVTGSLPEDAHLTQLVGAAHVTDMPLWEPGDLATLGIENVAELGDPRDLETEISAAIAAGTADILIKIRGLFNPPLSRTKVYEISAGMPSITLMSMIAPSPDWFVGVYNLSLRDENGWIDSLSIGLVPWDAGTEEGVTFSLDNPPTVPQATIASPVGSPFIGLPVVAYLDIQRIAASGDINENGILDSGDLLLATQFYSELVTPTLQQRTRADIMPVDNEGNPVPDGQITLPDILRLQQLILGL